MSPSPSVQPLSRGPARQINEEARANPNSHYTGKSVGSANGQVAAVGDDLDEPGRWSPRRSASACSCGHFSRAARRASASRSSR
jgi:hypothetical protein